MRFTVIQYDAVILSSVADQLIRTSTDLHKLRQQHLYSDLAKLDNGIYQYWTTYKGQPGVISWVRELMSMNPQISEWEVPMERDVRYWKDSRICDEFFMLFVRKDGTVLVSKDYSYVVLVLGIAETLGSAISKGTMSTYKEQNRRRTAGDRGYFVHGDLIGQRITTALLNWDKSVVYDGIMAVKAAMTKTELARALAAYVRAVDRGAVCSTLTKVLHQVGGAEPPSSSTSFLSRHKPSTLPVSEGGSGPRPPEYYSDPAVVTVPLTPEGLQDYMQDHLGDAYAACNQQAGGTLPSLNSMLRAAGLPKGISVSASVRTTLEVSSGGGGGGSMSPLKGSSLSFGVSHGAQPGPQVCVVCADGSSKGAAAAVPATTLSTCTRCNENYFCCADHTRFYTKNHMQYCRVLTSRKK